MGVQWAAMRGQQKTSMRFSSLLLLLSLAVYTAAQHKTSAIRREQ